MCEYRYFPKIIYTHIFCIYMYYFNNDFLSMWHANLACLVTLNNELTSQQLAGLREHALL